MHLDAASASQERSRKAFFGACVAAMVVLIVFFNITFSQVLPPVMPKDPPKDDLVFDTFKKEQARHYFDRFYYSLPIVGVQVSTDDLSFIAPLALLIFSLYYVSCMRSSFSQLASLQIYLEDLGDEESRERAAIAVDSQTVMNSPSSELPLKPPAWLPIAAFKTLNLYTLLIYLPAIASLSALAADIQGTYFDRGALDPPGTTYFTNLAPPEQVKVLIFQAIGLAITLVVALYCYTAAKYSRDIRRIVSSLRPTGGLKRNPAAPGKL